MDRSGLFVFVIIAFLFLTMGIYKAYNITKNPEKFIRAGLEKTSDKQSDQNISCTTQQIKIANELELIKNCTKNTTLYGLSENISENYLIKKQKNNVCLFEKVRVSNSKTIEKCATAMSVMDEVYQLYILYIQKMCDDSYNHKVILDNIKELLLKNCQQTT